MSCKCIKIDVDDDDHDDDQRLIHLFSCRTTLSLDFHMLLLQNILWLACEFASLPFCHSTALDRVHLKFYAAANTTTTIAYIIAVCLTHTHLIHIRPFNKFQLTECHNILQDHWIALVLFYFVLFYWVGLK